MDTETGSILLASDAIDDLPEDLEDNPRYLAIDPISSGESFTFMEDFVAGLGDSKEALRLAEALARPKPFRQFKDALYEYPELGKLGLPTSRRLIPAWPKNGAKITGLRWYGLETCSPSYCLTGLFKLL